MKKYLANAFSLQMLGSLPVIAKIKDVVRESEIFNVDDDGKKHLNSDIISAIGHEDTARVLNVPYNRINLSLKSGDILYVAQLMGGRLPEGATTLPKGYKFKFIKVTL